MESLTIIGRFLPEFLIEMLAAILCGGIIGLNRSMHHKAAGIRDNILICLGAVLYMNISEIVSLGETGDTPGDPARIAAQVVTGIGFIGAGVIIQGRDKIAGLTTGATIWVVGAVGLIIGADQVFIGIIATVFILLVLVTLHNIEGHFFTKYNNQEKRIQTMKRSFLTIISLLFLIFSDSFARIQVSENIYLDASFRPRSEFDNRDFTNETGYDAYASMRTRIGLRFENLIDNTNLYIMIGDSRMLGYSNPYLTGNPPGPNGYDNNLGVSKVYVEVKNIWRRGTLLKIGRMSNDQGRSYIFGAGNWNLFGPRTYDGLKVGYSYGIYNCNLWSFFGSNGDRHWYPETDDPKKYPDTDSDYKRDHTLTGLDLSLLKKTINFLIFLDLDQNPVADTLKQTTNIALSRTTTAVNLHWKQNKCYGHWFDFDAAYQFGTLAHPDGNGDISAYMLAGDWAWHFDNSKKSWIGLGFHVTSGDDANDPDKIGYFYDNYSSKHKTFGNMDYFKNPTSGRKPMGLQDIIIRGGISPLHGLTCKADFHHFTVEKSYLSDIDGSPEHTLGQELDMSIKYSIREGLIGELGVDLFLPSDNWKASPGDWSSFLYATLIARL